MTTENETMVEFPDRDIPTLLALDTYQGMTDSEIQSLIDWYANNARQDALNSAELADSHATRQSLITDAIRANASIETMLQSVVNRCTNIELGAIEYEQA